MATATILATDISVEAVAVAEENADRHNVSDRVRCRPADLLTLPADCADLAPFDVIAGNPPYVVEGDEVAPCVQHEPDIALYGGPDGMACLGPIIAAAPPLLAPGGTLILEFGLGQADAVRDAIAHGGHFAEPKVLRDPQEIERVVVAVRN